METCVLIFRMVIKRSGVAISWSHVSKLAVDTVLFMQISCLRGTVTSRAQTHLSADYDAIPVSLLFMWCATVRFITLVQSHNWELSFNEYIVCEIFYLKHVSFMYYQISFVKISSWYIKPANNSKWTIKLI